ncbi:MAG: IclR family transcriptional regulator [Burkholderiales bacterium]|jgi:DNA-binding IclR family transcriptional regulator|nr:IclR family transcriptional regulator [Burkholderiales bacterium]
MAEKNQLDQGAVKGGGVVAVARAIAILDAFHTSEAALTLGELARRTGLHKTTVLRIARTMAAARYLVQLDNGSWRLGPGAGWLGARYQTVFGQTASIEPVLRELSKKSGESAAFYVREGNSRICVVRVDGPQTIRHHVRMGESLPVNRGAIGRVLLAFSGEEGALYDRIRRIGYHSTRGERDPQVASVAFPIFGINHRLIGCVAVSGPIDRFRRESCARHVPLLRKAAARLSYEIGGAGVISSNALGPVNNYFMSATATIWPQC